ncbi:MAG: FAD-binding protein [Peptococcaceae bacterium]|jgi:succinate dehydrogenase/fumarate reductase flavoprotein subunit
MNVKVRDEIVKTDYLIIGGGVAGLQSAITAAAKGVDVLIAEKADTRRSGSGCGGNDHFMCYIPECHGDNLERVLSEIGEGMEGGPWQDPAMLRKMMLRTQSIVERWESYGINMKPTGEYHFEGHTMPNRQCYHLKYDGHNQKMCLTREAKKNGAKIMNKLFINDILINDEGRAVGAIGFILADDEPEVVVIQAKAVLVATAQAMRMYPNVNPAYIFNTHSCPAAAGGAAIAYRAGAALVNIDVPYRHAGVKGFARSGKATWFGVISDINGDSISPFTTKPDRKRGDALMDINPGVFTARLESATGPTYMNCTGYTEEDHVYQHQQFKCEGIDSITDYLQQRDIDLHKSMIEFGTYDYSLAQRGIDIGLDASTNVNGIYAAGICCGNVRGNITSASVWGDVAAESVADYVKTVDEYDVSNHPLIQKRIDFYNQLMNRPQGADWLEANSTLQVIMNDYVGLKLRSEDMMRAGIKYLDDLKRYAENEIGCQDAHQLMRTMELFDLIDLAKAVAITSRNRKESRGGHKRVDYNYSNPLLNNSFQTIHLDRNGKVVLEWREKVK